MLKPIASVRAEKKSQASLENFALELFKQKYTIYQGSKVIKSLTDLMTADCSKLSVEAGHVVPNYPAFWGKDIKSLGENLKNLGFTGVLVYSSELVGFYLTLQHGEVLEVQYYKTPDGSWNIHDEISLEYEPTGGKARYLLTNQNWPDILVGRQASVKTPIMRKAESLFGSQVECPHCKTKMVSAFLINKVKVNFCSTCKHCDYDSSIKNTVNAGNPSVEKTLKLKCKDPGSCEII